MTRHLPGCTGKKRHNSQAEAAAFIAKTHRLAGVQHPYACQFCAGWHLSTRSTAAELATRAAKDYARLVHGAP